MSNILKISLLPSTGVPVGALIVSAAACAVRLYWSKDDISGVNDAVDVAVDVLGSMRLLVSVAVPLIVAKPPVALALFPNAVTTPVPVVVEEIAVEAPPPRSYALAASVPDWVTRPPPVFTPLPIAVTTPEPVVVVAGAEPAPPPRTISFAASAAELAQALLLEKYGMPPEVPATVNAIVPLVVIGTPPTEIIPPVNVESTEVTVPPVPVAEIVIEPLPLVIVTPVPCV